MVRWFPKGMPVWAVIGARPPSRREGELLMMLWMAGTGLGPVGFRSDCLRIECMHHAKHFLANGFDLLGNVYLAVLRHPDVGPRFDVSEQPASEGSAYASWDSEMTPRDGSSGRSAVMRGTRMALRRRARDSSVSRSPPGSEEVGPGIECYWNMFHREVELGES